MKSIDELFSTIGTSSEDSFQKSQPRQFTALIADDDEFFRNWLKDELKRCFPTLKEVYEAASVQGAMAQALAHKPDIIFLDVVFRDQPMDGIRTAEQIWQSHPKAAILIVSSHKSETYVRNLKTVTASAGTFGWLMKTNVVKDVTKATEALLSGDCWIDREVFRIFDRVSTRGFGLTETEYTALVFIALGLSDRATAALCYLTEQAVQARLRSLYTKLGIPAKGTPNSGAHNPRCRAIWIALQRGLITEQELRIRAGEIRAKATQVGLLLEV